MKRLLRHRDPSSVTAEVVPAQALAVRQRLLLRDVRCTIDGAADSIAGEATVHLVLTNDSDHAIEYVIESVNVTIQHRTAETTDAGRAACLVDPGAASVIRCPSIRAVDRTAPSSGNIDYTIVYGHPDAPLTQRYRRQHGLWFRFEIVPGGAVVTRFVERYDEDDPAT